MAPRFLVLVLLVACDCGEGEGESPFDAGGLDGATPSDAAGSDASAVVPVPGEGECAWEAGERPSADLPPVHEAEYIIELERWNISNERGDPVETRTRINEAIVWATDNDFDKIILPTGRYLVGELTNDIYAAGIDLQGNMTFELADGAVVEMMPNDRHNYCVINVDGNSDVTIRGGEILGDRDGHDYSSGSAHDEGHGICAWTSVERVLIEDIEMHGLTGDGVLIVGRRGNEEEGTEDVPSTHVTIRNNNIHHNRRQGVSVVGGHNVVIENNHIHHIEGTSPQFGVDVEGAGRSDRDILIFQNNFHHNAGGDVVTSSGRNLWIEENTMTQCQVDEDGVYDPAIACDLERQVDGPIIIWKETDNVILNNTIRMSMRTVNGFWGILGYTGRDGATRENLIGNYIAGNTMHDCGIHMAHNMRYFVSNNTLNEGLILGFRLACTRLEDNRINRTGREHYKLRNVAGVASGNVLNREEGFPASADRDMHFPMANDAPYRNSSPVFW